MNLTPSQFDALDHLHAIDAHLYPVERRDLATTMKTSTDAAHQRMKRLAKVLLVEIIDPEHNHDQITYRITERGERMYQEQLARWVGAGTPPAPHDHIEIPSLLAARIIAIGEAS